MKRVVAATYETTTSLEELKNEIKRIGRRYDLDLREHDEYQYDTHFIFSIQEGDNDLMYAVFIGVDGNSFEFLFKNNSNWSKEVGEFTTPGKLKRDLNRSLANTGEIFAFLEDISTIELNLVGED